MGNKQSRKRNSTEEAEHRGNVKNNLELYLNDVYKKECVFKIEDEEVGFIKTGIETLTQNIVDKVLEDTWANEQIREYFGNSHHKLSQDYVLNSLTEVFLPISKDRYFHQYPHIRATRSSIIKVGSIYEGTRNGFPDEFDFIFLLYSTKESSFESSSLECLVNSHIKMILSEELPFCYPPTDAEPRYQYSRSPAEHKTCTTRRLCFNKYLGESGPAHTLQFIYRNVDGRTRDIHVDLVPARKIEDRRKIRSFLEEINPKSVREEALSAESVIHAFGNRDISLTQTEVHFMRHLLSKTHRKVYRILKYIINVHGDGDELKHYYIENFCGSELMYSSYKIKTMILYHHDECANSDTENIGPCVIQVLNEMCKYKDINHFPSLLSTRINYISNNTKFHQFPYLLDLAKSLKTMQRSQDTYDYEKHKIEPLSKQQLNVIEKEINMCIKGMRGLAGFAFYFQ